MTMVLDIDDTTSCRVDISLVANKYSIIWNLLPYSYLTHNPYKLNTILPDSRKTVVYDKRTPSMRQFLRQYLRAPQMNRKQCRQKPPVMKCEVMKESM